MRLQIQAVGKAISSQLRYKPGSCPFVRFRSTLNKTSVPIDDFLRSFTRMLFSDTTPNNQKKGAVMKNVLGRIVVAVLLVVGLGGEANANQPKNPCVLLGALTTPAQDVQIFAVDLKEGVTSLIGNALPDTDVAGIAVHPVSGILYALVASHEAATGFTLITVDRFTGARTQIGPTGLDKAAGLAIRPTDGSLWTWAQGLGPAVLDTEAGTAQVVGKSNAVVTDIAWGPDGATLWAAGARVLWKWNPIENSLVERSKLPVTAQAVAMRADGRLLLPGPPPESGLSLDAVPGLDRGFSLQIVDPKTGFIDATLAAPPIPVGTLPEISAGVIESLTWAISCGNPSPGGPADLIQSVSVNPSTVCPGGSVQITVETRHPEGGTNPVEVTIAGMPGSNNWIQFEGVPGTRKVSIAASTAEGYFDTDSIAAEVIWCDPTAVPPPVLRIRQDPYNAELVDLEVQNAELAAPPGATFLWEFGDGSTVENSVPFVRHAYTEAIPRDTEFVTFDAAVTVQLTDDSSLRTMKTVSIWNQYAADKKRGLIRPPVKTGETQTAETPEFPSIQSITPPSATYTITNVEDSAITLTGRQVEHQYCDPDHDPAFSPWQQLNIVLEPGGSISQSVLLPADEEICGVGVHLIGTADILHRVATDIYFETQRNPSMIERVSDSATLAALNAAAPLLSDGDRISEENLFQLSRELRIPRPEGGTFVPPQTFEPDPYIGLECQPGEPPPYEGISCQATEEWTTAPPHIHNALKGDVIVSTACGFVGDLLRAVHPPQFYSHSGIMTANYYNLAHSTASIDRYKAYPEGGGNLTEGIREDVLQYGWPGIVRQTVRDAFGTVHLTDPNGATFEIQGFSQNPVMCPNDAIITYPQVIRPPAATAEAVRPMLAEAADIAKNTQHGNYRLYAYTDTSIATVNYDDYYWYYGPATMCSGFVWRSLRQAGVLFEGDQLEPRDIARGASPTGDGLWDGLYGYDAAERLDAGEFIHDFLTDQVYAQAGWFGDAVTDAADDLANQFTNCFASDWCAPAAKDSEAWRDTLPGQAVSPENMLFWDPPEDGGAFGYNEPLVYRNGDNVRVYRWARSFGAGDLRGVVMKDGARVEGATVILDVPLNDDPETLRQTGTGPDGTFSFLGVPSGSYTVRAQMFDAQANVLLEATGIADIPFGGEGFITLTLTPPPGSLRRLTFQGTYHIEDDEAPLANETQDGVFFAVCDVDPYVRSNVFQWTAPCTGDEVVVIVNGSCELEPDDRTVRWDIHAELYEQTDCDPTDLDGVHALVDYEAFEDQTAPYSFDVHNEDPAEPDGHDWARFSFTLTNGQQP